MPHIPSNVKPVSKVGNIKIDQAVIGSCTNGRIEDMRAAGRILKGRKINPSVRCIIIPATQQVYMDSLKEGLIETFIQAGAVFSTPTCGPCLGGHMGVLGPNETCITSTTRNFKGRMGDPSSKVFMASPATVAASALTGVITDPREFLQ